MAKKVKSKRKLNYYKIHKNKKPKIKIIDRLCNIEFKFKLMIKMSDKMTLTLNSIQEKINQLLINKKNTLKDIEVQKSIIDS